MILLRLKLENFQGLRSLTLDFPDGCCGSIYGDNATGKTTVYNALTWLLFDKASTSAKSFTPKTRDAGGDVHHLNHGVTGTFRTESGRVMTLQKVYHEVYKKKRGAAHEEFDGHTTDYFLDGVPVKEKEYTSTILNLCGGDTEKPKMLTMPDYFPEQMPWDMRRKILLEVCGDITDDDVIRATPELKELPDFLLMPGTAERYYTIEEYRKIAAAKRKDINRQLEGIPERIDEAQKAIPDLTGYDEAGIEQEIQAAQKLIAELTAERATAATGSTASAEVQKQIAALRVEIAEKKAKHFEAQSSRNAETNTKALEAKTAASTHRRAREDAETDLRRARAKRDELARKRETMLAEYQAIAAERWEPSSEVCPTCGQRLPAEKVEQMRSDFNLSRSRRLEAVNQRGKTEANKSMVDEAEQEIKRLEALIEQEAAAEKEQEALAAQYLAQCQPSTPFEATDEYLALSQQIAELTGKLADESKCVEGAVATVDERIKAANEALSAANERSAQFQVARYQRSRIEELEAQEKRLASEYDETEKGLYLCDVFTKAKVSMLDSRINGKFQRVRFQLFTDQLNGGVKEGCEVLVPAEDGRMIPYAYANNAARINAGLEIISTLAAHWDVHMPVFVDNAESVTHLIQTGLQTIRLVVSEQDKTLRLEVVE
ncbi:MAG: AAA family ATPase [Lachnospiraceae bacterium]|nr:AAA family ATPase [Lachnospiraceae bacterium]